MDIDKINNFIQMELKKRNLFEVNAIEAAKWLDEADLLKDSKDRPGLQLRDLLRDKKIKNAFQRSATYWIITRED